MKKESRRHAATSRRNFAKRVGAALAAGPLLPLLTEGQTASPAQTPSQVSPPPPLVEATLALARARFGDHLTTEQLAQLRKEIESGLRTQERLRAFQLENSAEPDFVFSA